MESLSTVEKAVDVLFHLHAEGAQGVSAIGRALGLPKSSTHRLLTSLAGRGLVERDARGAYRPGIALVALGLGALESEPAVAAARPVLEAEADALGETVFLVAARAGRIVVLDKAEGTGFLRAAPRIGGTVPVHATAVGKLYLAFAEDALGTQKGPLQRYSERTLTDARALARDVERARKRGFAENRDEWIPGLAAVAAPIFSGDRLVAAISAAAATQRMQELGPARVAKRCVAAAGRIAARLDGRAG